MNKTALITGGTRGIGKATAIELAKIGYTVHILGRNAKRGKEVIQEINTVSSNNNHKLFIVDLAKKEEVKFFLDEYIVCYDSLDVLMLNAGVLPERIELSDDGIDKSFSIGYISRYMFSVRLNKLLSKSPIGKVLHINGGVIGKIEFDQLSDPQYKRMTTVWQNSVAGALLVHNWSKLSNTDVAHMHIIPGFVDTNINRSQGPIMRFISKTFGSNAQKTGKMLAHHISNTSKSDVAGKFFIKDSVKKTKKVITSDQEQLKTLISFSEQFTGVKL